MFYRFFFFFFITTFLLPLRAAPPRLLAWDDEVAKRKLELIAGRAAIPLEELSSLRRTPPVKVKSASAYRIRALDKETPGGAPAELPVAIPNGISKPLLVLLPDDKHTTGLRVFVINDDPSNFRWGSYRFLNVTTQELVVQLEKKAVRLPPAWKTVDLDLGGKWRGMGARIALAGQIEKPLYSAVWEYDPDMRTLCFIVPGTDPRLSPISFKVIPESKIVVAQEAAEGNPAKSQHSQKESSSEEH